MKNLKWAMLILLTPLEVLLQTITLRATFRLILLTGLIGIMVTGYGGRCNTRDDKDESGSSAPPPPALVTSPNLANNSPNIPITITLTWTSVSGATSYDVYFGTDNPPSNIINGMNQAGTSYNPGTLSYST
ncbi:MAG: hypothetical protein QME51_08975, partial [Planctomycetota bacterium]|nr:hypothetical protein [Planctomycetota bacterium]